MNIISILLCVGVGIFMIWQAVLLVKSVRQVIKNKSSVKSGLKGEENK